MQIITTENTARAHFAKLNCREVFSVPCAVKADLDQPQHKEHNNAKANIFVVSGQTIHTDLWQVVNND